MPRRTTSGFHRPGRQCLGGRLFRKGGYRRPAKPMRVVSGDPRISIARRGGEAMTALGNNTGPNLVTVARWEVRVTCRLREYSLGLSRYWVSAKSVRGCSENSQMPQSMQISEHRENNKNQDFIHRKSYIARTKKEINISPTPKRKEVEPLS